MISHADCPLTLITTPSLLSRFLYPNPVCFLCTTSYLSDGVSQESMKQSAKSNIMVLSWLSPKDNSGNFIFSMNHARYSAKAVVHTRSFFVLAVPIRGMEEIVLLAGRGSASHEENFAAVDHSTQNPQTSNVSQIPPTPPHVTNKLHRFFSQSPAPSPTPIVFGTTSTPFPYLFPPFASSPEPPPDSALFSIEGCAAHLLCKVNAVLSETDGHFVCEATIHKAYVKERYWETGKLFKPAEGEPEFLSFYGAQTFGYMR